jgi:iron complex transport system substrate-binding protein
MAGAPYKDVWYAPAGNSWQAMMLEDAGVNYIYADTEGTGSLSFSTEQVLHDAAQTEYWIAPGQFIDYRTMQEEISVVEAFRAFEQKNVFTYALTLGEQGGVEYYESASMRPDIVLKDLVDIFYPQLLPDHEPYYFKPLKDTSPE